MTGELVTTANQNASLAVTLGNPNITLVRACGTYLLFKRNNKALSVLSDLFMWHVARGTLSRSPVAGIERAKVRQALRITFTVSQVADILAANPEPHDQIALRLLLHFGIRKGALLGIRFEHFDRERGRLTVFTKGETIHVLPIVDEHIWELLDQLREPGHHYLLCRQKLRKRISPSRSDFEQLSEMLGDIHAVAAGVTDSACADEIGRLQLVLDEALGQVAAAAAAAAVQVRRFPSDPVGEHGAHSWWYRCLARAGVVAPGTTAGRKMHAARHTAIQNVLDVTGNLKAAQTLAGHKNVGTTGDIYSDWSVVQLEGTMREVLGT